MKKMTCKELGGACELEFQANSFDEMAQLSRRHGMDMMQSGDADHLKAMDAMREMMKTPGAMDQWFAQKKQQFENLPEL